MERYPFLDCNEIIPDRLWVGCYVRPEEVEQLRLRGITTVVSLQSDDEIKAQGTSLMRLLKLYQEAGIGVRRVPTADFDQEALATNLDRCIMELEQAFAPAWARVYLHCTAGINRSPTTAAAYLIRSRGLTAQEACDYVSARRHCRPYLQVLVAYAASVKTNDR